LLALSTVFATAPPKTVTLLSEGDKETRGQHHLIDAPESSSTVNADRLLLLLLLLLLLMLRMTEYQFL